LPRQKNGDTVKIHYTGKLEDGTVFDTSNGPPEPLQFKIGEGKVIPGFEQAIAGMNTDDSKTTKIPAKNAYGPHLKEMVQSIDRTHFPEHIKPQIGQQLQIPQDDGKDILVKVAKVSESSVTLDAKHPLAGKDLTFDIQLVGIA
jgi:FKBP-type peptidyl-prolyl cis-trans isomerase 2